MGTHFSGLGWLWTDLEFGRSDLLGRLVILQPRVAWMFMFPFAEVRCIVISVFCSTEKTEISFGKRPVF